MQTELNKSGLKNPAQTLDNPGFDQMAQSLSTAIAEFSDESGGMFSSIVDALHPAWDATTSYVRRHPVQIAVGVAAIGFVSALLMRRSASLSMPRSSDGRQY